MKNNECDNEKKCRCHLWCLVGAIALLIAALLCPSPLFHKKERRFKSPLALELEKGTVMNRTETEILKELNVIREEPKALGDNIPNENGHHYKVVKGKGYSCATGMHYFDTGSEIHIYSSPWTEMGSYSADWYVNGKYIDYYWIYAESMKNPHMYFSQCLRDTTLFKRCN